MLCFVNKYFYFLRSMASNVGEFFVKSGSTAFKDRQKSIFDQIAIKEANVNLLEDAIPIEECVIDRKTAKRNRKVTRSLRGQESLFKTPNSPPPRKKRCIPDFQRNPHRWTKYTLADVPASDLTEASNTAAALSFLRTVKKSEEPPSDQSLRFTSRNQRRIRSRTAEETFQEDEQIIKSVPPTTFGDSSTPMEVEPSPDKASFINGKLTMPEYVVGEKNVKTKKVVKPKTAAKELRLSHLLEYEDE